MASANRAKPAPDKIRVWEAVGVENDATDGLRFKIMSYNVLAQSFLESNTYLFKRCDPLHLLWEVRISRLLKHIFDESPDVLCLQEVEVKHLYLFNKRLEDSGYSGIYKKKTGTSLIDGCATYFKKDVFVLEEVTRVEFYQPKVSVMDHHHVGIIVKLRPCKMPNSRLVVANTHLLCHPKKVVIRLAQLRLFLAEIDRVSYEFNGRSSGHLPIILTGDLNSHPDSSIIKLLEEGQINKCNDWIDYEWKNIGITDNCQHLAVYLNRIQDLTTNFEELEINNSEYCNRPNLRRGTVTSAANKLHSAMYIDMFTSEILSHSLHFQSVYDTARIRNDHFFQECCHDIEDCTCNPRTYVDYVYFNSRTGLRPLERLRLLPFGQFPNQSSVSDHQSLVVIFELKAEKPY